MLFKNVKTNKTRLFQAVLMILIIGAYVIHHRFPSANFTAGILLGSAVTLLVLYSLGKYQANKAAAMLDKHIKDIIVENFKNKEND